MALELSVKADLLLDQVNVEQQLILEIDGIPFIYGAVTVTKLALYGDDIVYGQDGLVYGGVIPDPDGRSYISLEGTTRQLTQQLEVDRGGTGSVQKFNVTLIDKNQEVTDALTPGNFVPDVLSREANVYVAFQGGAHPEDSVRIFNGIVTGQEAAPGRWRLSIDHPEFLKRQDLFQQVTTNLTSGINASQTSIPVISTSNLILPQDAVSSYVQIDDELIQFTSFTATSIDGLTRGALGTVATSHDDEADVTSFYTLSGSPIDLSLKLMLSDDGNNNFKSDVETPSFVQVDALTQINNGIFFPDTRIQDDLGLEVNDFISITGASEAANNFSNRTIAAFLTVATGTVIVVNGAPLVIETESNGLASFKSQFNTLPSGAGCAMKPSQVDVTQHLLMKQLFPSIPDYLFYIKDTINAKEFLSEQIYFPAGFYQVPRKGRNSVNTTIPPLVLEELIELNDDNVEKANNNKIKRQITKDFYNNIVYKFDRDTITDKFLGGAITFSQRSLNRIETGTKSLTIESDGFRGDEATRNFLETQARRFSDRYQFAAESIEVETNYKTGFPIEIADVVLFGNSSLKIPDINEGSRDFKPRLMEVVNKKLDIRGTVKLKLLDTGLGLDGRFGVISPNSFIGSGSTTNQIVLQASFGTGEFDIERNKYENFLGEEVRVRSADFTFQEVVKLIQFDPTSLNRIIVSPALSVAPPEGYILDLPDYPDDADPEIRSKMKTIHCFFDPTVDVASGISDTEFTVAPGDIDKFLVDAIIIVHNGDFTDSSTPGTSDDDLRVLSVDTGTNTITTNSTMGFTPAAGYKVNLIGFKDGGFPYRVI